MTSNPAMERYPFVCLLMEVLTELVSWMFGSFFFLPLFSTRISREKDMYEDERRVRM